MGPIRCLSTLSVSAVAGREWTACPARVVPVRDGLSEHGHDVEVITAGNNRGYQIALVDFGQENFIGQVLHKIDQQLQLSPRIWEMESEDDCQWACREICGGLQSMESRHTTRSDDIDGFCSFRAFLYICNLKRTVRLFFHILLLFSLLLYLVI